MGEEYLKLLNEANKNLGYFNEEITQDTIDLITGLTEAQQKALFNEMLLIGQQRGFSNLFTRENNSFKDFIIDGTEFGWTIQDYMLDIIEGESAHWIDGNYTVDQQAQNLVKDYEQDVESSFHYKRKSKTFPTTIKDIEYKKAFYPKNLGSFVDRKISNLTVSGELWLKNSVIIEELFDMLREQHMVVKRGYSLNTGNGVLSFLETLKTDYTGFSQDNAIYNKNGKISITPSDDFKYIITKASNMERIKVREYAGAFNLEQMELDGRIIYIPESMQMPKVNEQDVVGEEGEELLFMLVDRRAIVVAIQLYRMGSFYVADQYKTNHWLGIDCVTGNNPYINAVAYTGEALGNFQ